LTRRADSALTRVLQRHAAGAKMAADGGASRRLRAEHADDTPLAAADIADDGHADFAAIITLSPLPLMILPLPFVDAMPLMPPFTLLPSFITPPPLIFSLISRFSCRRHEPLRRRH
jgi:hypothetical protein